MKTCTIKELKKGDFFTLKNYGEYPDEKRVYVRGDYERSERKYSCTKWSDFCAETFKKGTTIVYTDFTF